MVTHTCEACGHVWPCAYTGDCEVEGISRELHGKVLCVSCLLAPYLARIGASRPPTDTIQ